MPPPKKPVIENVGLSTFLPIAVSSVAYVFGTVGSMGCRMVWIYQEKTDRLFPEADLDYPPIQAGLFGYKDGLYWSKEDIEFVGTGWCNSGLHDPCRPYGSYLRGTLGFDWEKDGYMSVLQIFAIIITAIGGPTVLAMMFSPCFPIHRLAWYVYGVIYFILGVLQAITTQVFNTNVCKDNPRLQYLTANPPDEPPTAEDYTGECVVNRGWRFCLTASILWFFAALITFKLPAPKKKVD